MEHPPVLETERLILRPFQIDDAPRVKKLVGAFEIYRFTLAIPHPYEDGMAEKWISTHASRFYEGAGVDLAITLKADGILVGAIGLEATPGHQRAELGYWIGVPYWGNGYCTEAAIVAVRYGFEVLRFHKITSMHMESNPASGRVMQKAGMSREGALTDHVLKDGRYHTMIVYAIINSRQRQAAGGRDPAAGA
ncbi:MAG: GNAT family N-acetyltransferase [Dehalococcoidia bacterium]